MFNPKIKPMLFSTMKGYNKSLFLKDLIAGIIVAIIALPLSIALAIASGVSPEKGIHTAIIAGFMISFLGGSRVQIGGPTAAFVVIVVGIIGEFGLDGLIVATILAGIMLVVMGLLGVGSLIKFIPSTITVGFTGGIAVTLFVQQLKDFLGLEIASVPSEFFARIASYAEHIGTVNPYAILVGAIALLLMIVLPKINEKIPASLVAIVVTTLMVKLMGLDVATIGSVYGKLSGAFPLPSLPKVDFAMIQSLISPAFTIAILAAIESLLSCVVSDGMIGSRHRSNTELVAQGVGNICSGLFGGIPATGAIARTAANVKNGGRTPVAGMIHAVTLALIMVVLMPYASLIPMTTLSAVLIVVAYNMSGWREFVAMRKSPRSDFVVLIVTFVLTVCFDLVIAIEIGMLVAAAFFLSRMASTTDIRKWVDYEDMYDEDNDTDATHYLKLPKSTIVYEITGPMFFGMTDKLTNISQDAKNGYRAIVLRMRGVPSLDASACNALRGIYTACKENGIVVVISHINEQPMSVLRKEGLYHEIGEKNFADNIHDALARASEIVAEAE